MRRTSTAFIFIFICFITISCKKDESVNPSEDKNISQLFGSWQWIKTVGGFAPTVRTPQSTGQTQKVIFYPTGSAQFFRNDTLINQLSFIIKQDSSNTPVSYLIHYNSATYYPDQFIGYGDIDTLYLIDNCMDCYRTSYVRTKQ